MRESKQQHSREGESALSSFRAEVSVGEDVVDPMAWAGVAPVAPGIAPRIRVGKDRWFNLLWLLPIGFVLLLAAVAAAKGLRNTPAVAGFIADHPGTITSTEAARHPGLPVWVGVQHFFNLLLLVFILRSGLQILSDHPRLYWTRHSTPGRDWFRIQKPVPTDPLWTAKQDSISLPGGIGLPGLRHTIGLARWWHLGTDTLWLANGLVFYALLFSTGQWRRVVPTSWDVFPSALSVLIQYLSLDWPLENGWAAYNSLQLLAYFITVFLAAPLALLTGLGMSPALSTRFKRISKVLSIQTARSLHFLVMIWFLTFLLLHVMFVATTGLLRNLNHIYLASNDRGWVGFVLFSLSMVVLAAGWVAATPFTLRHPRVVQKVGYALIGPAQRMFEHLDATPGEYSEADISPYFWHNGQYPASPTTGCASTASSRTRPRSPSTSYGHCRFRSRSPSTSVSRAGPGSPSGGGCRCRPCSTWRSRPPTPAGSSSTASATGLMAASITTRTPSSR